MAVTNRNSALYLKLHVNKYLGDARDRGGRPVPIPFSLQLRHRRGESNSSR